MGAMSTESTENTGNTVDPAGRDPRDLGDELLSPGRSGVPDGPCRPVVHTPDGEVLVVGHAEVAQVACDPHTFSSAV